MAQGACLIVPNNWKTILDKNGIKEAQMSNILQSFLDENGLTSSSLSNVALENTFKNWYSKTFNTEGNIGDLNDKISPLIPNINIEYRVPGNNESDNTVSVVEDKNTSSQTLKITFPALNYGAEVSTKLNSVMYNFINSRDEFADNSIIEQAVNSVKTPRDIAEYLGIRHTLINSLGEQDNAKTTKRALELVEYRKKQSPELQYSDHYSQENTSNTSVEVTLDGRGALRTSISPKNTTIQSLKKQIGNEEWNNFVERIDIPEDQIASYITKTPAAKYYFLKQLEAVQALILRGIYNNNPAVDSFRSLIKTDLDSISLPITSDMLEFAFRRMFGSNNVEANIDYDTLIKTQEELNDIKAKAIKDGTFMKAPNGKPTNLNEQQWLQVRTKAFKEWFGDWENDQKNASKVVDENGEPLVVYHTGASGITSFRTEVYDWNDMPTGIPNAIYTTDSHMASTSYNHAESLLNDWREKEANLEDPHEQDRGSVKEAMLLFFDGLLTKDFINEDDFWEEYIKIHKNSSDFSKWYLYDSYLTYKNLAKDFKKFLAKKEYNPKDSRLNIILAEEFSKEIFPYPEEPDFSSQFNTYSLFVRMIKPKIIDAGGKNWNKIDYNGKKVSTRDLEYEFEQSEYDGVIVRNVFDYGGEALPEKPVAHTVFISYSNTYVKSATDNIGTFSTTDDRVDYDTLSEDEASAIITALNINTTPLNVDSNTVYGIDKIEELLNKFNSNEVSKQLANKVLNIAKKLGIKVVFTDSLPIGSTGAFTKNTIYLSKNYYENSNNNTKKASTMLHEMIHAISTYALKTEDSKLSKPLQDFKKELRQLFSELKDNPALKGERGIVNEREFIAELANPIFREKLQSIDKNKKKSLWQRIIDVFKKLFGIKSSDTYYTKMMDTLDKAINAFDAETYREYNSRNKKDYDTFIKNKKELDDIKEKAIKDGTFMKAPNGNPTNLTEQQWLQVRTKAFKNWFGDWESIAEANRVSLGKTLPNNNKYAQYGQKGETDIEIREVLDENGKVIGTVRMEFSGKNRNGVVTLHPQLSITRNGYGTALYQHIANTYGIPVEESFGEIGKSEAGKALWNKLQRRNNAQVSKGDIPLRQILPINASKVVDENGEPLVVYHGTNVENISIFDRTKIPEEQTLVGTGTATFGNFFSDKQDDAKSFAAVIRLRRKSGKATVYDVFLNIKNPMYFETLGDFRNYSSKKGHYNENGDFVSDVKLPEEYDGVIVKRRNNSDNSKEFVAPSSNQIKSATNNNGDFSKDNDDIDYDTINNSSDKESTIIYTPKGKKPQTYTIRGTHIFNKSGKEVFKEDTADKRAIFANLAVKQGRAVVVEYDGNKYVVNRKDQIISVTDKKELSEKNKNRKAILAAAHAKFSARSRNAGGSTISTQPVNTSQTVKLPTKDDTINIYAGTNENADLSNLTTRSFKLQIFENEEPIQFNSVEQAFQYIKFKLLARNLGFDESNNKFLLSNQKLTGEDYKSNTQRWVSPKTKALTLKNSKRLLNTEDTYESEKKLIDDQIAKILNAKSGYEAKKLGGKKGGYIISGHSGDTFLDTIWDYGESVSEDVMSAALKASFEQNPDDAKRLLLTGDATLTHTQDQGKWRIEFPRLLMEVRDDLRTKHPEWMPNAQAQPSTTLAGNTYTNHSGGATGSDTYWSKYGERYGVISKHYYREGSKTPTGNTPISDNELKEADKHLTEANKTLGRRFPTRNEYVNNLLRRDWFQVKNADAVFAISTIEDNNTVFGGTGWAVQMAIDNKKPVHVFDIKKKSWFEYNYSTNSWENTDIPVLTPNFAGIGAHEEELNKIDPAAKFLTQTAISNVYSKTFNNPTQTQSNEVVFTDEQKKQFSDIFQGYFEGGGASFDEEFTTKVPDDIYAAVGNYFFNSENLTNTQISWILNNIKPENRQYLSSLESIISSPNQRAQQRQAIQTVVEGSENSTQLAGSTLISNGSLRANVKTDIDTTTPLYKLSMQLTPVQFYRRKDTIATWFNQNAEWNAKLFKEDIDKRLKNLAEGDEGKLKLERIKVSLEDIDNFIRNAIPYIINDWEDIEGNVHKGIIRETKGNIETALYGDSNKKASDEEGNTATYDSIEEGLDAEGLSYLDKIKDKDWNDEDIKEAVLDFLGGLELYNTEDVDIRNLREQFQILYDNFDLIFKETLPIIEERNNVKLSFNDESTTTDQTDETDKIDTSDNDNLTEDTNGNKATGADGYGIKARQQDPAKTMRAVTRRILSNIEDVDPSGETKYDDLGMPIHLREAWVHSVLMNECSAIVDKPDDFVIKDKDGNYDFPALDKLEEKYPWVSEIKNRLWDNEDAISALYADVGAKVFMPVYTQKIIEQRDSIGGVTRTSFPVNAKASEISILNTADSLYRGGEKTYIVSEPKSTESLTIWDMYGVPNTSNIEKVNDLIEETLDLLNKQEEYKNGERVDEKIINDNFNVIYRNLADALTSIGIVQSVNVVAGAMTASDVGKTKNKIKYTIDSISLIINKFKEWKTKDLVGKNSLVTSYNSAYKKIADNLGTISETYNNTTFRQQGKSYPSYVNPNYIDKMVKTISTGEHIEEFLKEEFGYDEFFYDSDNKKFRSPWLQLFTRVVEREEYLGKKTINIGSEVRRNFALKHIYDMDTIPYSKWTKDQIMCNFLHEYFHGVVVQDRSNEYEYAYYALPPLSDTEIAVFVKAPKVTMKAVKQSEDLKTNEEAIKKVKERLLPYFVDVTKQELVRMRRIADRASNGARQISNYDTEDNKKEFLYFPHLNDILVSKDDNGEFTALTEIEIGAQGLDKNDFVKVLDYIESINESKNREQLTDKVLKAALDKTLADDSQEFYESLAGLKEPASDQKIIGDGGIYSRNNIEEFYLNNALAQVNIIQLFATDLSFTKNYTDFVKRIKEIYASGTKLNTNSKYGRKVERSIYLKDKIVTSNSYTRVRASLDFAVKRGYITEQVKKSLLSKWKKINATDAQAYRTASSFRAILDMLGRWSPDKQDAITRLANGEGSSEDFYVTFDTIKPFLFANVKVPTGLKDANGNPTFMRAPMHHKDSEIMLLAFIQLLENAENSNGRKTSTLFAKSPQLTALNEFMEKHDIDVALFESAVKCGCSGPIDINFTEDIKKRRAAAKKLLEIRELQDKLKEASEDDYKSITSDFPDCYAIKRCADVALDNYMLAQPEYNDLMDSLAPSYDEVKNILERSIVPENGNPNNDALTSRGELQDVVHEVPYDYWMEAQPTSGHLVDAKSIYGSQAKYLVMSDIPDDAEFEIKTKSQTKSMKGKDLLDLYNSLFVENLIEDFGKASTPFTNIKELQKKLRKMLKTNPSYGMDTVNALDLVVVDGKPQFNIPLFNSTVSNKVEQLINSIFKNNVGKQYINGGACVLMSNFGFDNNLKIIRDENGAITGFECYLPASTKRLFSRFMRNVYDKKGNIIGKKIDIDRVQKECPEILEGIGYRIPTEGKYSMANFIVKDFLPQQCGAAIMMPAELTLLSGSDFDIDKLYMMLKAFEVGEDGIPRVIEYDLNKSPQEQSREARNNMLIDIMRAILSSKYVSYQVNHPGNYEHITGESFRTKILNNRTLQEKWKEIHREKPLSESLLNADYGEMKKFIEKYEKKPNPLSLATYAYYHHQNMVGKELVAIYALNTTMQGKYQQTNLGVAPYYQFTINGFNVSSLHEKERTYYDSKGNVIRKALISSNNEEFSAASVDNVKDPRLADLMQTKENAYITNAMVRMGIDIKELGLFTALPFYRLSSEGYFAVARDYGVSIDKYDSGDLYITSKELMEINEYLRNKDPEEPIDDSAMKEKVKRAVNIMYRITKIAEHLEGLTFISRPDSPNGAIDHTLAGALKQVFRVDDFLEKERREKVLTGYEILVNNLVKPTDSVDDIREAILTSPIPILTASYTLGIQLPLDMIATQFPQINKQRRDFLQELKKDYKYEELSKNLISKYLKEAVVYGMSRADIFTATDDKGNDVTPAMKAYYLVNYPQIFKTIKSDSKFAQFEVIRAMMVDNNGDIVIPNMVDLKGFRETAIRDLNWMLAGGSEHDSDITNMAIDLFRYSYFKDGLGWRPSGFSSLFDSLFLSSIPSYLETIRKLTFDGSDGLDWNKFDELFTRNHPTMIYNSLERLAPSFGGTPPYVVDEQTGKIYVEAKPKRTGDGYVSPVDNKIYEGQYKRITYKNELYEYTDSMLNTNGGISYVYTKVPSFNYNNPCYDSNLDVDEQIAITENAIAGAISIEAEIAKSIKESKPEDLHKNFANANKRRKQLQKEDKTAKFLREHADDINNLKGPGSTLEGEDAWPFIQYANDFNSDGTLPVELPADLANTEGDDSLDEPRGIINSGYNFSSISNDDAQALRDFAKKASNEGIKKSGENPC